MCSLVESYHCLEKTCCLHFRCLSFWSWRQQLPPRHWQISTTVQGISSTMTTSNLATHVTCNDRMALLSLWAYRNNFLTHIHTEYGTLACYMQNVPPNFCRLIFSTKYCVKIGRNGNCWFSAEAASAEGETGAVVLVIAQSWAPGGGKTPVLTSPGVDTAPLIDSTPRTETAITWNKWTNHCNYCKTRGACHELHSKTKGYIKLHPENEGTWSFTLRPIVHEISLLNDRVHEVSP